MKSSKSFIKVMIFTIATFYVGTSLAQVVWSYQAYVANSRVIWQRSIDQCRQGTYQRALAQYGYLNGTMADRDHEAFQKYYDPTLDLLDELIESENHLEECKAIKSAIYGLELSYSSWKGMFLGPKSSSLIEEAYQAAPDNALVVKLYASSKMYTPEMFGGDPALAAKEMDRAVVLFEAQKAYRSNWLYLDALALLGNVHRQLGHYEEAMMAYDKALSMEPDFGWVAHSLKPSLQKEMASK